MGLEQSKRVPSVGTPLFPDEGFKVNVRIATRLKASVEGRWRFAGGRSFLVGFERTLDNISDRTLLPLRQTTGKISRLRASD